MMGRFASPLILECSTRGDKRFSAFCAKVEVYGKLDSIENHYHLCKRFGDVIPKTWKDAKGKKVTHIQIGAHILEPRFLSQWYKLLWYKYLIKNPDLIKYASGFTEFSDMFRGKSINCQADIIKQAVNKGVNSLLVDSNELLQILKGDK